MNYSPPVASTVASAAAAGPPRRRRWQWWLGGAILLLAALAALAALVYWQFDPWLRRMLERQVAEKSRGRYQLRIGELRTSLRARSLTLTGIRLRPQAGFAAADSLPAPWLALDVGRLRVGGIGLGALLRRQVVPVDSLLLDEVRARVLRTPPEFGGAKPLHEQLPPRLAGIRLGHLALRDVRVHSGPASQPTSELRQGQLTATDLLISRGGAADHRRLGYAAAVELHAAGLKALVPGHAFSLGAARFSSRRRRLELDSLRVQPRTAGRQPGAASVNLELAGATLTGLHPELLGRRELRADTLRFRRPQLTFGLPATPPPPLHEALAPYLRRIQLAHLQVANGWLRVTGSQLAPTVQAIQLRARQVQLDPAGHRDPQRLLYARAWELRTGPGRLSLGDPYQLRYQTLALASQPGTISVSQLLIRPTVSLPVMARRKGHQVSHLTARLPRVQAAGFDFAALLRRGEVRVRTVEVRNPRLDVRGNSQYPIKPHPSTITPEQIGQLPFRLDVRRLQLTNGNLYFTFLGRLATRWAHARITRLNGTATNLSNDPRRMTDRTPMVLRASAYLQGRSRLRATGWFALRDPRGRHRIAGTFGPAPVAILNDITEPGRYVRFRAGQVQGIRFEAQFDQQQARGTMWARYSGLKLEFLSRRDGGDDQKTLFTKAKSKLVNGLVIRDQNPRKGELQAGTIRSRREPRYAVFALWQQAMVSGLLHSIGVPRSLATRISQQ
ncbi:hypothetical protein [Hymenobacter sp. B81]|uniref:hypothetical protein n=1 Tax=Hymenobacter sp. B81 TaxID=3344878 RepID=UPI0037DC8AC3